MFKAAFDAAFLDTSGALESDATAPAPRTLREDQVPVDPDNGKQDSTTLRETETVGTSLHALTQPKTLPPTIDGYDIPLLFEESASTTVANSAGLGQWAPCTRPEGAPPVTIVGDAGNDLLHGTNCGDVLRDHAIGDILAWDHDEMFGHGGNDTIIAGQGNDTLHGGDGRDDLYGGLGVDTLNGGEGSDTLNGNEGGDLLNGDAGLDVIYGGDGNDIIDGGEGDDWIRAGNHDDIVIGGAGNDRLWGDGYESPYLARGDDTLLGGAGDDYLKGMDGDDLLDGGEGNDELSAEEGDDTLLGGAGNDILFDGRVDPVLGFKARSGNDFMDGGTGDDLLLGATGANVMTGGAGADAFAAALLDIPSQKWLVHKDLIFNTVTDYNAAEGDRVQGNAANQVGGNVHVTDGNGALMFVLVGVDLSVDSVDLIPF